MARESGGGGALGWTLLGFLAGIAATLGVQTLMGSGERPSQPEEAVSSQVHITKAAPSSAPAKPPKKKAEALAAASTAPAPPSAAAQADSEVEDDAAAAGMTSRVSSAPTNNN